MYQSNTNMCIREPIIKALEKINLFMGFTLGPNAQATLVSLKGEN